jgi:hypothetical protein
MMKPPMDRTFGGGGVGEGGGTEGKNQREGMGLLEYQTMPSLHDEAHDGFCVHLLYNRSWKFHQLAAPVRATGTVRKRQAVRPFHHIQSHTCRVTLLHAACQAGRRVGPAL